MALQENGADVLLQQMNSETGILKQYPSISTITSGLTTPKEVLDAISSEAKYNPRVLNDYAESLTVVLSRTVLSAPEKFETILSRFLKNGIGEAGGLIRELNIQPGIAEKFDYNDPENENVFKKYKPNMKEAYHNINSELRIAITISDELLIQSLQSSASFAAVLNKLLESMQLRADIIEEDLFRKLTNDIRTNENVYVFENEATTVTERNENLIGTFESLSQYFQKPTSKFTIGKGIISNNKLENTFIVTTIDLATSIKIKNLAQAFNMTELQVRANLLTVDTFNIYDIDEETLEVKTDAEGNPIMLVDNSDIQAIVFDKDLIVYEERINKLESIGNPKGLYRNFFYHKHDILGVSPYKNVAVIVEKKDEVPEGTEGTE